MLKYIFKLKYIDIITTECFKAVMLNGSYTPTFFDGKNYNIVIQETCITVELWN